MAAEIKRARAEVDTRVAERITFTADRYPDVGAGKHADPVEVPLGRLGDERPEVQELGVVETAIGIALGFVQGQHGQLAPAVQGLGHLAQVTVLGL